MPQLPFEVTVSLPTVVGTRQRLGRPWAYVVAATLLAGGGAAAWIGLNQRDPEVNAARLEVASDPAGATVEVDGSQRGVTPLALPLPPGEHRVGLRLAGYAEAE